LRFDGGMQRGFRTIKFEDPWRDGRAARLGMLLRQPKTILLGSSRVVLGYDIDQLRATQHWPAYNASSYNSSLAHRLSMLRYAAIVDRHLKHVLIEIFPGDIVHAPDFWRLEPLKPTVLGIASEALPVLLSLTALRDSLQVIARSRSYKGPVLSGRQHFIRAGQDKLGIKAMPYSAFTAYRMFPPQAVVDSDWPALVDAIVATCKQHELECTFMLSPMNARILYGYQHFKFWSELEALVTRLASVGGAYSFLWYNKLNAEPASAERSEWIDPLHHTITVGNMMLDIVSGKRPSRAGNEVFAEALTVANSGKVIEQLRIQRDEWLAGHPESGWSYGNLADSLAHPVGKSEVAEEGGVVRIQVDDSTWIASGAPKEMPSLFGRGFSPAQRSGHISGWAADSDNKLAAEKVAVVYGNRVVGFGRPWFDASNNGRLDVPAGVARSGFLFAYQLPQDAVPGLRLRVFSLDARGSAVELGPDQGKLTW